MPHENKAGSWQTAGRRTRLSGGAPTSEASPSREAGMATGHVDVVDHHVISGWVCPPKPVLIVVNGRTEDVAEWGGPREDARQVGYREAIGFSCRLARHLKSGPN